MTVFCHGLYNDPSMVRRTTALAAALCLLASCAGRRGLREPADAYLPAGGPLARVDLDEAAWTVEHEPDGAEAPRAAFLLARGALEQGRVAELERRIAWIEQRRPGSPWLPAMAYLRLLAARDEEGSLRLLQRASA